MSRHPLLGAACAVAVAFCASSAHAAVVLATYQGTATGFALGSTFQNVAFSAVLTIDDALGTASQTPVNAILQGSGAANPVTAAYIEIAGVRHDLSPSTGFLMAELLNPKVRHIVTQQGPGGANLTLNTALAAPIGGFALPVTSSLGGTGSFTKFSPANQAVASFSLRTTSYHVAAVAPPPPTAPVPEPSAWALMILGFGSAGALLRRRRAIACA